MTKNVEESSCTNIFRIAIINAWNNDVWYKKVNITKGGTNDKLIKIKDRVLERIAKEEKTKRRKIRKWKRKKNKKIKMESH